MTSHPLIETALGRTEQAFIEFVEQHARACDLPSGTVRVAISTSAGEDCYQAVHSIEVRAVRSRVWRIEHSLKKTEAGQSRLGQLETRFTLTGPGVPDAYGRRADIEAVVDVALDAIRPDLPEQPLAHRLGYAG